MVDFSEGEPIRLLPCMHFYHMRCIDDWLMRSYSCPTCMERVDVGILMTSSATTTTATADNGGSGGGVPLMQTGLRRRGRRSRRERVSSTTSEASLLSNATAAASSSSTSSSAAATHEYFKGQGSTSQFFPVSAGSSGDRTAAAAVVPAGRRFSSSSDMMVATSPSLSSGRDVTSSLRPGQVLVVAATGREGELTGHTHSHHYHHSGRGMEQYRSPQSPGGQVQCVMPRQALPSGQSTTAGQSAAAVTMIPPTCGQEDIRQVPEDLQFQFPPQDEQMFYNMAASGVHQRNFQYQSPHHSPFGSAPPSRLHHNTPSPPFSPPVFEYHFDYPPFPHDNNKPTQI